MLGPAQWAWLEQELRSRPSCAFRLEHPGAGRGTWLRALGQPAARARPAAAPLEATKANGVILLSGDRHSGALYKLDRPAPIRWWSYLQLSQPAVWAPRDGHRRSGISDLYRRENFGLITIDWQAGTVGLALKGLGEENAATLTLGSRTSASAAGLRLPALGAEFPDASPGARFRRQLSRYAPPRAGRRGNVLRGRGRHRRRPGSTAVHWARVGPAPTGHPHLDGETLALDDGSELRLIGALAPAPSTPGRSPAHGPWKRPHARRWAPWCSANRSSSPSAASGSIATAVCRPMPFSSKAARRWVQGHMLAQGLARAYLLAGNRSLCQGAAGR